MKKFSGFVIGLCQQLDKLAGLCIVSVMVLVVANILLRVIFNYSILGTYELVGFLTALGVGLSLAHCALQNGHIAVEILVNRLTSQVQVWVDIFINLVALGLWGMCAWHLGLYAKTMMASGLVSLTAQIPVYPVIYLVALSFSGLCLVLLVRSISSISKALAEISFAEQAWEIEVTNSVRKAVR